MEVETDTVTMEISVVVPQEAGNRSTTRSRHPTLGNLLMHAHCFSHHNSQKPETASCPSADERIMKMCWVYTTDYYSVIKKNKNHKIFR